MGDQVKFVLDETHIPKSWYNLAADLPKPLPPVLHPGTKLVGRAFTVQFMPLRPDLDGVINARATAPPTGLQALAP